MLVGMTSTPLPLPWKLKGVDYFSGSQKGVSGHKGRKLGFINARNAYFHAKVKRPLYVALPSEALNPGETGMCGRLNYSFYGMRDAARNWEEAHRDFMMTSIGFKQVVSSP